MGGVQLVPKVSSTGIDPRFSRHITKILYWVYVEVDYIFKILHLSGHMASLSNFFYWTYAILYLFS